MSPVTIQPIDEKGFNDAKGVPAIRPMSEFGYTLLKLDVKKGFKIAREDWDQLTPPNIALFKIAFRHGMKIRTKTLEDGSGWLILRIK